MTIPEVNEQPFDFSKYFVENSSLPLQISSIENKTEEPFDFSKYAVDQKETI